jgi:hypothetical protein
LNVLTVIIRFRSRVHKPKGNLHLQRSDEAPPTLQLHLRLLWWTTLLATFLHGLEAAMGAVAYCFIGAMQVFNSAMLCSKVICSLLIGDIYSWRASRRFPTPVANDSSQARTIVVKLGGFREVFRS